MPSKANERQVGGSHYQQKEGVPQHWDLALMYGWDPFQYQITKYVMRWKDKGGLDDLEKAAHFLEKYIEANRPVAMIEKGGSPADVKAAHWRAVEAMKAHYQYQGAKEHKEIWTCKYCKTEVVMESLAHVDEHHTHQCPKWGDPTKAYVSQG